MWADNETSLDLINVQHLVGGVANVIRKRDLLPVTVGVYGGWGQGKSSLIQMIREDLEQDDGVVCVTFNGWLFESYDDAKSALMGSILERVDEKMSPTGKAKTALQGLTARIDWFRAMSLAGKGALTIATGGVAGLGLASVMGGVEAAGSALEEGKGVDGKDKTLQTVRGFREDFVELLKETGISTLVVFIDELDRCLPNAVVETLEAIRLFLFVEGTAFVIGADEELVRHAVNRRFEHEGMKASVGGAYLEKMVQIPFRIPPMSPRAMRTYMNLLFTQVHIEKAAFADLVAKLPEQAKGDFGEIRFDYDQAVDLLEQVPAELAESFGLTALIADVLTQGLKGNPRQLKRFLNMLMLRLDLAERRGLELERRPLGKLMLLEYFHPEMFEEFTKWRFQEDECAELRKLEAAARVDRQTADDGSADEVAQQEEGVSGGEVGEGAEDVGDNEPEAETPLAEDLSDELRVWIDDEQLLSWLRMEPALGDRDLRPYLYITQEQTGVLRLTAGDLSPKAADVLKSLWSGSKSQRLHGESAAGDLSQGEAASVLRHLSEDMEKAEVLGGAEKPPIASLLHLCKARPELLSDLVALFKRIPPGRLPVGAAPALENSLKEEHPGELKALLERWAQAGDQNSSLATAAQQALTRLNKGT